MLTEYKSACEIIKDHELQAETKNLLTWLDSL